MISFIYSNKQSMFLKPILLTVQIWFSKGLIDVHGLKAVNIGRVY
jgi:hypothetical protein